MTEQRLTTLAHAYKDDPDVCALISELRTWQKLNLQPQRLAMETTRQIASTVCGDMSRLTHILSRYKHGVLQPEPGDEDADFSALGEDLSVLFSVLSRMTMDVRRDERRLNSKVVTPTFSPLSPADQQRAIVRELLARRREMWMLNSELDSLCGQTLLRLDRSIDEVARNYDDLSEVPDEAIDLALRRAGDCEVRVASDEDPDQSAGMTREEEATECGRRV